jgi:hypothetical protein
MTTALLWLIGYTLVPVGLALIFNSLGVGIVAVGVECLSVAAINQAHPQ